MIADLAIHLLLQASPPPPSTVASAGNDEIPWAGIGALLLGLGSTFTGLAAIITAKNAVRMVNDRGGGDHETHLETNDPDNLGVSHGGK